MKRKVIKQGHNTLTITLPRKWTEKHSIKPGDELSIEDFEKKIVLSTEKTTKLPRITINVESLPPRVIWRFVSSIYRMGYDEFKIEYGKWDAKTKGRYTAFSYDTLDFLYDGMTPKDKMIKLSPVEVIQSLINRLIGVEIIDQRADYCVVKEMGETTYKEFDNALRRIFLLLISMAEETVGTFTGSKDILRNIDMIDTNLDRFTDFCLRVLNKKGYKNFRKTPIMYSIIFLLEMVGDEYKKIAIHLLEIKKMEKCIKDVFKIQFDQLRRFYTFFYNFDKFKALEIYEEDKRGDEFNKGLEFRNLDDEQRELLHHLKKIGIYLISLAELRIDLEF